VQQRPHKTSSANATRELFVILICQHLKHDSHPVYLDVTFDQMLNYKHLKKTAGKLKSLNNLLMKLAGYSGYSWDAGANTLRSSALVLSVDENCAPVLACFSCAKLVDVQLNAIMQLIALTI